MQRNRTKTPQLTAIAYRATKTMHSWIVGVVAITALTFLVVNLFTDGIWPIMIMNFSTGSLFALSALHLRYRHLCPHCPVTK